MPLNAANMVTNGHLTHDDVLQFVNLLTGVMTDQPVTISNTLRVTGVTTLASDAIVAGTIKYGTTGASTTTIYSPSAGQIAVTAALTLGGGLFFNPDNSNDIGATGTGRPRNIFVAGALTAASATLSGTLNFSGNARRITGDMTSTPTVNRLWFQTSVANGSTALGILPNGTSTISAINMSSSSSDPDNAALGQIICTPSFFQFTSGHQGTGVAGALSLAVDGVEAMHVRTDLHVGFNDPGDPAIHFRLKTANKLSTAYGFQHVDPTPANIFYTRNDGYVFIQGPLAMGNGVGTGSTTGILMGNGAYISTYTNASDVRVLMNALTVTPGLTSTNTFQANGPSTLNGNASVIGTLTVSSTLNMQNATVQNCTTYYGVNNGCYLTNDGANWNIAGNFAFYGSITSLSNLNLSGTITYPVNIVMSGTGCITTNTGYLYLRSATGNVYMDSGPLIVTNGYVNVAQYVQSPLYYVGSTTMYIQQAN
ncbi:MAG TPA: hypothetical protein VLL82_13555, partial [Mycobacterium sp.]|nr:hypothetical protein [Mycobacterium sp.]